MRKITISMTENGYYFAKAVYEGGISRDDALDELEYKHGMSRGSASDYIQGFKYMMTGRVYKRTFNTEATDFFLEKIFLDYGIYFLELALKAVKQHIEYYNELRNVKLESIENIYKKHFSKYKELNDFLRYDDELDESIEYLEGRKKIILVNAYERNYKARKKCIDHHGLSCNVCKFNFEESYGDIGKNFIHVHHLKEISLAGREYELDPVNDLRPVCPNCHAMLHKKVPAYTIEELKGIIRLKLYT